MTRWLDNRFDTIYLIAEDGKKYAFQPRKTDPEVGFIAVKGPDGRRFSVTGNRIGNRFVTNPLSKNASAMLSKTEIDEAKGLPPVEDIPASDLSPIKRSSKDYSLEEVAAMSEVELADYKRLIDSELKETG